MTAAVGGPGSVEAAGWAWDIPAPALRAYRRAAQVIDAADATCHLDWTLLAAIGRVESDHGRVGGSVLGADGTSTPAIFGPRLDGTHYRQAIPDTDGGELDGDASFDRAVGPMQFIPATWSAVKVDADGDGVRNPQNIDDAALGAAVYLCSGSEDLAVPSGERAAVLRYNHSERYADLVLRIMEDYAQGQYTAVPAAAYAGTTLVLQTAPHDRPRPRARPHHPRGAPDTGASPVHPAPAGTALHPADAPPRSPAPAPGSSTPAGNPLVDTVSSVAAAVPEVISRTQASVACLEKGISSLDVVGLATCVAAMTKP